MVVLGRKKSLIFVPSIFLNFTWLEFSKRDPFSLPYMGFTFLRSDNVQHLIKQKDGFRFHSTKFWLVCSFFFSNLKLAYNEDLKPTREDACINTCNSTKFSLKLYPIQPNFWYPLLIVIPSLLLFIKSKTFYQTTKLNMRLLNCSMICNSYIYASNYPLATYFKILHSEIDSITNSFQHFWKCKK
jgi:hypothetical protein